MFLFSFSYNNYLQSIGVSIFEYNNIEFNKEKIIFKNKEEDGVVYIMEINFSLISTKLKDILFYMNNKELMIDDVPLQFFKTKSSINNNMLEYFVLIGDKLNLIKKFKNKFESEYNTKIKKVKYENIRFLNKEKNGRNY